MSLDEEIREAVANIEIPTPRYTGHIIGITIFIWDKSEYFVEPLETFPYEPDGTTPLVFVQVGKIEFIFESKFLYKLIYKRKFGKMPGGM